MILLDAFLYLLARLVLVSGSQPRSSEGKKDLLSLYVLKHVIQYA